MRFYRDFLLPTGLLAGTIIGAGVFALPFVFVRGGLAAGFGYLLLAAGVYAIVHLLYADVIVSTPDEHRFVGYLARYLGTWSTPLAIAVSIVEMVFVMTIYLILSASFIHLIVPAAPPLVAIAVFWAAASFPIFAGLRKISIFEFLVSLGMLSIMSAIFAIGVGGFSRADVSLFTGELADILLPFGPLLFALSGRVAIPSTVAYFKLPGVGHRTSHIPPVIIAGTVVPAALYALFVVGVIGLSPLVAPDALSGLSGLHPAILTAVGILGLLALWSSYFVVGIDVRAILHFDLKWRPLATAALVLAAPLTLYLLGFQSFIGLVSLVGGIFLGLEGLLIIALWLAARKKIGGTSPLAPWVGSVTVACAAATFAVAFAYELYRTLVALW